MKTELYNNPLLTVILQEQPYSSHLYAIIILILPLPFFFFMWRSYFSRCEFDHPFMNIWDCIFCELCTKFHGNLVDLESRIPPLKSVENPYSHYWDIQQAENQPTHISNPHITTHCFHSTSRVWNKPFARCPELAAEHVAGRAVEPVNRSTPQAAITTLSYQ